MKIDFKKLEKVVKKYKLKLIIGFGSYFENPKFAGDIDIAIYGKEPNLLKEKFFDLNYELNKCFNEENKELDLVILNFADPLLLKIIALQGHLLYGKEIDFEEFYLYAMNRYLDYSKILKEEGLAVEKILEKL